MGICPQRIFRQLSIRRLSIRAKLIIFMTLIIVITSLFNLYFYYKAYIAMDEYNNMLKDYARVNNLSIQLIQGRECIDRFISSKDANELTLCQKYEREINTLVNTIASTANTMDTFLWSKAIKNAVTSYNKEIHRTFQMEPGAEEFYNQYLKAKNISLYIENYIKQLLDIKLTEGEWYHQKLIRRVELIRMINLVSVIGIMVFSIIYVFMFTKNITEPLKKLTRFAKNISRGDFDTGKLDVDSSNDINILANTFNTMAQSIQHMIAEITEKSNIERKLHEEELKNLKISEQLNEARFLALQSQINPHFLFNTLNAISRTSMFEKAKDTTKLIESLSNIFRYNLENLNKEVSLTEELAVVKEYVYIQQIRFGSRIGFNIVYRDDLSDIFIPRFIIQPLVENAIIHGIEPRENGGTVRIKVYKKHSMAKIKIIDNGTGIPKNQIDQMLSGTDEVYFKGHTTGIGINNVRDRMTLYCKDAKCFSLKSKPGLGTVITISVKSRQEAI